MDGPVIELETGRITFEVTLFDPQSGQSGLVGLLDEQGALKCLAAVPAHVPAEIIATAPVPPGQPGSATAVLGRGVVSYLGRGRCIEYVVMRPDEDTGTRGLDVAALELARGRRVHLGLRLLAAACGCGGVLAGAGVPGDAEVSA